MGTGCFSQRSDLATSREKQPACPHFSVPFGNHPRIGGRFESAHRVGDFARELRPAMLDHGLIPSLRSFLQDFGARAGFLVSMTASEGVEELEANMRTALYRVAQEALTNVALHAKATRVDVVIQPRDGGIAMEIRDDGQGILVNEQSLRPGLLGVRERVEMVGGHLVVESATGKPTTLRVQFPGRRPLPS